MNLASYGVRQVGRRGEKRLVWRRPRRGCARPERRDRPRRTMSADVEVVLAAMRRHGMAASKLATVRLLGDSTLAAELGLGAVAGRTARSASSGGWGSGISLRTGRRSTTSAAAITRAAPARWRASTTAPRPLGGGAGASGRYGRPEHAARRGRAAARRLRLRAGGAAPASPLSACPPRTP